MAGLSNAPSLTNKLVQFNQIEDQSFPAPIRQAISLVMFLKSVENMQMI